MKPITFIAAAGLKLYSHGGADIAHRATLHYFPEINAGVAALSNNGSSASEYVANALVDVFFSDELQTFYVLEVKDSTLTLLIRNTEDIKLNPV